MIAYVVLWAAPMVLTLGHRNRRELRAGLIAAWPPNMIERRKARIEQEMAELDAYWKRIHADQMPMRSRNRRSVRLR